MSDSSTEQLSRLQRAAKMYSQVSDILTPGRIALLLGALLLLVIGVFGGWGAASDSVEEITEVEAGKAFGAAPFELTVKRAFVFDEIEGVFPAEEGKRYLSVSAEIENLSDLPVLSVVLAEGVSLDVDGLATIELDEGPHVIDPRVVRLADSLSARSFQPGLSVDVVLVWQQRTSEPIPKEIQATFSQHTWRRSVMDDTFGWRDPVPTTRVGLALNELEETP